MAAHISSAEGSAAAPPAVRQIGIGDVVDALRCGIDDFSVRPSHYVFICLIYPVAGAALVIWTVGGNATQLIYPMLTGFALVGPIAAIPLYEISRQREAGLDPSWPEAFAVVKAPSWSSILAVGLWLTAVFIVWLVTAQALYAWLYATNEPATHGAFLADVVTTGRGWTLIILGNAIGFVFAVVVLSTTVVAFPLLVDRHVGASEAIRTSMRAVQANPVPMLAWGLIVAALVFLAMLPALVGLAVVLPVLGHATWHVYRKVVEAPPPTERRAQPPRDAGPPAR
ncbi:DUF2189 domain-containing protein [soil metagenome]